MKPMPMLILVTLAVVLALCLVTLAGCGDAAANVETTKAAAQTVNQSLQSAQANLAELEAQVTTMPAGPQRDQVVAVIAAARPKVEQLASISATLNANLAAAQDGLGLVDASLRTAASVPTPWQPYAILAAGLATAVIQEIRRVRAQRQSDANALQAQQNAAAAAAIAKSIELAKQDGMVNFADAKTIDVLNATQGVAGKLIVDQVQKQLAVAEAA